MTYLDLTLTDLQTKFGITNKVKSLFDAQTIIPFHPSTFLLEQLKEAASLPIRSEKARSELILTPILLELRKRNDYFFTIYSGDQLNVDKASGLVGECDFILSKETHSFSINTPILTIVEAKKQDVELGINQCAAQLYGAYLFNQQSNTPLTKVYGCVTTADSWKFLLLEDKVVTIDRDTYYKNELSQILGIFQAILDYYKDTFNREKEGL